MSPVPSVAVALGRRCLPLKIMEMRTLSVSFSAMTWTETVPNTKRVAFHFSGKT